MTIRPTILNYLFLVLAISFLSCKKTISGTDNQQPGQTQSDTSNTPTTPPTTPSPPTNPSISTTDAFLYGSNMGYYAGWSDEQLSEILIGNPNRNIPGAGVNSLRPAMYEHFVNQWGYDVRLNAFKFYQQLGAKNHVIFLNGPTDAHRDKTRYCSSHESETFANLYEPIWMSDGKVNDNNYYAKYVYHVVKTYSPYVKFWEVWNEPDYTNNWNASQTWTQTNPNPCDLNGFYAPVQHYVRMLRITYEVVKSIDKNGVVCLGGIGYPGFMDAVLRNTDNPNGGAVTGSFPEKGGAWFDCVSFHIYPMYGTENARNSDAAAKLIADQKTIYQNTLSKYDYNGATKPLKDFIITECNIPRKSINGYIGSDEAQRNFLIKAAVTAQKSGIRGIYVYGPTDNQTLAQADDPYKVMGFYQPITSAPYNVSPNSSATSWRTVSRLLKDRFYDKTRTDAMQMPASIDGGAFYSPTENNYVYVLWAKSSGNSETSTAAYSFPASWFSSANLFSWDEKQSQTGASINLTASPVFIKP